MTTAKIKGIEIYYEVHGRGEPLLLIMGLGANATGWYAQIPALSKEYQVIAFDNRGAGRSEKPHEPYTIARMAEDAIGVLDTLSIGAAHVFGMSLGGMIAQELALLHPERVKTLVLGGTMCGGPKAVFAGPQLVQQFTALGGLPLQQAAEMGLSLLYSDEFIQQHKLRLVARALSVAHLSAPIHGLQRQFMAIVGFNTYDRLPSIRVPTLVLTGTADKVIPSANSRLLADTIPAARLIEFEGSGHGFLVERADEANTAVLDFLRPYRSTFTSAK
jgi:pimeloyl-ACP methyl ester carboxylesterase